MIRSNSLAPYTIKLMEGRERILKSVKQVRCPNKYVLFMWANMFLLELWSHGLNKSHSSERWDQKNQYRKILKYFSVPKRTTRCIDWFNEAQTTTSVLAQYGFSERLGRHVLRRSVCNRLRTVLFATKSGSDKSLNPIEHNYNGNFPGTTKKVAHCPFSAEDVHARHSIKAIL